MYVLHYLSERLVYHKLNGWVVNVFFFNCDFHARPWKAAIAQGEV
jgi:pectate lyase